MKFNFTLYVLGVLTFLFLQWLASKAFKGNTNLPFWFRQIYTLPNSPDGLIMRAERLEELTRKTKIKNYADLAKVYRALAEYNWPRSKTRAFIEKEIRAPARENMKKRPNK